MNFQVGDMAIIKTPENLRDHILLNDGEEVVIVRFTPGGNVEVRRIEDGGHFVVNLARLSPIPKSTPQNPWDILRQASKILDDNDCAHSAINATYLADRLERKASAEAVKKALEDATEVLYNCDAAYNCQGYLTMAVLNFQRALKAQKDLAAKG
jgi:hypothetical protein